MSLLPMPGNMPGDFNGTYSDYMRRRLERMGQPRGEAPEAHPGHADRKQAALYGSIMGGQAPADPTGMPMIRSGQPRTQPANPPKRFMPGAAQGGMGGGAETQGGPWSDPRWHNGQWGSAPYGPIGQVASGIAHSFATPGTPGIQTAMQGAPGQMMQQIYGQYLGRQASPEELQSQLTNIQGLNGFNPNDWGSIAQNIANSPEGLAYAQNGQAPTQSGSPQAQAARYAVAGMNAGKMANTGYHTPKYDLGRIMAGFDPNSMLDPNSQARKDFLSQVQANPFFKNASFEGDKLRYTGQQGQNVILDILNSFDAGKPSWQYGIVEGRAGGDHAASPSPVNGGAPGFGGLPNDWLQKMLASLGVNF